MSHPSIFIEHLGIGAVRIELLGRDAVRVERLSSEAAEITLLSTGQRGRDGTIFDLSPTNDGISLIGDTLRLDINSLSLAP